MVSKIEKKIIDDCIDNKYFLLNKIDQKKWQNFLKQDKIVEKKNIALDVIKDLIEIYFSRLPNSYEFLKSWNEYENILLYTIELNYRDHFLHQFYVFLLGCYIFKKIILAGYRLPFSIPQKKFANLWLITSIFHDLGYPTQKVVLLNQRLLDIYFKNIDGVKIPEIELNFEENKEKAFLDYLKLFSYGYQKGESFFYEIDESFDRNSLNSNHIYELFVNFYKKREHGIMGGLFILDSLRFDLQFFTDKEKESYNQQFHHSAFSLSLHNIQKYKKTQITFGKHPISYFLTLCESLQEWHRPKENPIDKSLKKLKWGLRDIEIDIKYEDSKLTFKIDLKLIKTKKEIISKEKEYFKNTFKELFEYTFLPQKNHSIIGPNFNILIDGKKLINAIIDEEKLAYKIK
ncbi:MAG: hypothetical protein ACTSRG_19585 [Candidatus Helarchaeota archaeon]